MSKALRSLKVSSKYADTLMSALIRNAWTQQDLADRLNLSRSTISSFFNGKHISRLNFMEICHRLDLDWQEIADLEESNIGLEKINPEVKADQSLSQQYQLILRAKDQQIALLTQELKDKKKENAKLLEMIELMSKNSGNIYIHDSKLGNLNVSNFHDEKKHTNIYKSQNLIEAAQEIQGLLEQLEQVYPSSNIEGKEIIAKEAIKRIDRDVSLSKRIINALKVGSTSALESLVEHPAAHLVVQSLEDWKKTKQ